MKDKDIPKLEFNDLRADRGNQNFGRSSDSEELVALRRRVAELEAATAAQQQVTQKLEEALQQSEARYRLITQFSTDAVWDWNLATNTVTWNEGVNTLFGYTLEQVTPTLDWWLANIHPEDRERVSASIYAVLDGDQTAWTEEYRYRCADGHYACVLDRGIVVHDQSGRPVRMIGGITDITSRVQAEEALRESEARFRAVWEIATDAMALSDPEGIVFAANPAYLRLYGYSYQEVVGHSFAIIFPEDSRAWAVEQYKTVFANPDIPPTFESVIRRADGTERIVESRINFTTQDRRRTAMLSIIRDITERKEAETALRHSEEKYRALFENTGLPSAIYDREGVILLINKMASKSLGETPDRLMGKRLDQIFLPEQAEKYGSRVRRVIDTGRGDLSEDLVETPEGPLWFLTNTQPILGSDGQATAAQVVAQNITKTKQVEEALRKSNLQLEETLTQLKATQQRVVQQERLAAVGQLAAGIAHDFNNLLTGIIGFAELLQLDSALSKKAQTDLARIIQQGQRGAHLVRQILDFARRSIHQPRQIDLALFVAETIRFLERTIAEEVHVRWETDATSLPVRADPGQLQQMLSNLALNARDALPYGGEFVIHLSRYSLAPGEPAPHPELPAGEWAVIRASDNGAGIAREAIPHIFEPFFTTKEPGAGSGLGLAQVYGIVKQHEGYIDVTSQVGQGTTFFIYLPLDTAMKAPEGTRPAEIVPGDGQLILLVEEEEEVLGVSRAMLERLGYRVLTAHSSRQALELYTASFDEIALVLVGVNLPVDGTHTALLRSLRKHNRHVKVVLMSGYSLADKEVEALSVQGIAGWLQKPMTLNELARVINQALQNSSRRVGN